MRQGDLIERDWGTEASVDKAVHRGLRRLNKGASQAKMGMGSIKDKGNQMGVRLEAGTGSITGSPLLLSDCSYT